MSRPKPRRSSLAGASPVAPPTEAQPEAASSTAAAPSAAARSKPSVTVAAPTESPPRRRYPPKVSFYQEPEDSARMRAAFLHTQGVEGLRSLSHFIDRAFMVEVKRLEARQNDGRQWPAVQPGGSRFGSFPGCRPSGHGSGRRRRPVPSRTRPTGLA